MVGVGILEILARILVDICAYYVGVFREGRMHGFLYSIVLKFLIQNALRKYYRNIFFSFWVSHRHN